MSRWLIKITYEGIKAFQLDEEAGTTNRKLNLGTENLKVLFWVEIIKSINS